MTKGDAERRAEMLESHPEGSRRQRREEGLGASRVTARREYSGPETGQLMEAVVERENMKLALARVEQNRGAAGVDKMTVEQLRAYLREHWLRIKEELLADDYHPQPVLKVEIPKPGGKGMRVLGIPTVMDRLIQQALHQVLSPIFEPDFSESSYGFRPNRSAQQAVLDKELERRGHKFCRYADDCNIYVQSQAAGERVLASVTAFLEGVLRLRVNREKSAVAHVEERKFLGHRLLRGGELGVAP